MSTLKAQAQARRSPLFDETRAAGRGGRAADPLAQGLSGRIEARGPAAALAGAGQAPSQEVARALGHWSGAGAADRRRGGVDAALVRAAGSGAALASAPAAPEARAWDLGRSWDLQGPWDRAAQLARHPLSSLPESAPAQGPASADLALSQASNAASKPLAEKPLDPAKIQQSAATLRLAMDGCGTNEGAIHEALRGKSPAEIAAIRKQYTDQYPGSDLDKDLDSELSGKDRAETKALLSGDRVQAAVASLDNAANGGLLGIGTDESKINRVLEGLTLEERKPVMDAYQRQTGQRLDSMLCDELSGNQRALSQALLDGDKAMAAAVRLDEAADGGVLTDLSDYTSELLGRDKRLGRAASPGGLGTNEEAIYHVLGSAKDQKERDAIAAAYEQHTGRPLQAMLTSELSGAELDAANALNQGDEMKAAAARMKAAEGRWYLPGTDEQAIYGLLETSPAEKERLRQMPEAARREREAELAKQRQGLIATYNRDYGAAAGGRDFDQMLQGELSGLELKKAQMLARDGRMTDEFAMQFAMEGPHGPLGLPGGTDEGLMLDTVKGKTRSELAELERNYKQLTGKDLRAQIATEVDGRDAHYIGQALKGRPETLAEAVERQNEDHRYERVDRSGVATGFLDLFSGTGEDLDRANQRLNAGYDMAQQDGVVSPEEQARLRQLMDYQELDVSNYQQAKDETADVAASTAGLAASCLLGPMGFGLVGTLTSGALGTGAYMTTKQVLLGDDYGEEARAEDWAFGALDVGIQAALPGVVPGSLLNPAKSKIVPKIVGPLVDATGGALSEGARTVLDPEADLSQLGDNMLDGAMLNGGIGALGEIRDR